MRRLLPYQAIVRDTKLGRDARIHLFTKIMFNQGEDVLRLLKEEYVEEMVWFDAYWCFHDRIRCAMGDVKVHVITHLPIWRQKYCAKAEELSVCDFVLEPKEPIQQRLDRYSRAWEILFNCLETALVTTPYVTEEWLDGMWLEQLNLPCYDKV
jgi:hypothetical protein